MTPVFSPLAQAVVDGREPEDVQALVYAALSAGQAPLDLLDELTLAIRAVGDDFGRGDVFLPDLLLAARAMQAGAGILKEELSRTNVERPAAGRVLLGSVHGDLHDIGKSLVRTMLEVAGYEVRDLGVDVAAERFVDETRTYRPQVLGLSALLTAALVQQQKVIRLLEGAGLRDQVHVVVGGAVTSQSWAGQIGADGWAENAADAVTLVDRLLEQGPTEHAGHSERKGGAQHQP